MTTFKIRGYKWEREHQVRERKIKQLVIRLAEDVASIHITGKKDFVLLAGLEERQNFDNLRGEIAIDLLMETRVFINNPNIHVYLLIIYLNKKEKNRKCYYIRVFFDKGKILYIIL